MSETKPFIISKTLVMEAYKLVKANAGAAGIDQQTLEDFDRNLKSNLYKIWNRMSSGSYFPPPVKAVSIPKKSGGERILGIPTVSDRIAQMIVKLMFEPTVEPHFHQNSYGYRPNKSALDAVGITRQRCWKYDWVLEFDIKGLFDNIDHDLLMKAVRKHTDNKWVILYIERWLKAPLQLKDGILVIRNAGVPQGGVISPVLANLFLHYVFDTWMTRKYPRMPWCRYSDDGLIHCNTEQEAQHLLTNLKKRFEECSLMLHPDKTKIIYCKDGSRKGKYEETKFDFLGYTFRPRLVKNSKRNSMFISFTPAVSQAALKSMKTTTRQWNIRNRTDLELGDIARMYNPVIRGWLAYYGKYSPSALYQFCRHFNKTLVAWGMRKYKELAGHKTRTTIFIGKIVKENPELFVHWNKGMIGAFA
ncbi:group II intron reverse transcriptase/maturase [Neochlamydia sp. EPS4]|uniref:group II intron reverse transcriptase/maturase n=1 Tax=Neochlamydia sp. EPS4 TaxID=1478175 RepID=UPI0009B5D2AD|nr:group II intron reverse transcriptase/maturase [Neochlamydia sp. EPS4]